MTDHPKRKKHDANEFIPPEPQCIELVHNQEKHVAEFDLKSITIITKFCFKKLLFDYLYEINFPIGSKLKEIIYLMAPNLYSITIPGNLTIIDSNSFKKCEFLQQITFIKNIDGKSKLSFIGDQAFNHTIIQSLTIPDSIKEIGSNCFPPTLKEINFENGAPYLEKVHDEAFKNTQIQSLNMPLNIKPFINSQKVFSGCKKLKKIIFDNFVNKDEPAPHEIESEDEETKDLALSTMLSYTKIEKLELFSSNINYFWFENTPNLTEIIIPKSDNSNFFKQDGCLYTRSKKKLIVAERNVKSANICQECQIITNFAFNVKSLEKVSFDKNSQLKKISFFAFHESNIKNIEIPDTVADIEIGAFLMCKNLESANIPRSLNLLNFGTFAFTKLREITIPKSVTKIGCYCFFNCCHLKSVRFEKDSNLNEIEECAFLATKIESISIPKSVKKIGNYCFADCHSLKSVDFDPQSELVVIGHNCFKNTQIETFQLPQKIQEFDFSFSKATSISFPDSSSFLSVSNLQYSMIKEFSIPSCVDTICAGAFCNCINLTEVRIIDLKNSKLETISENAFLNCENLTTFELPEKVKYFGLCSFKNCTKYTAKIKLINNNKITVCKSAFERSGIVSFESKSKSINVNDFAFYRCHNLVNFSADTNEKCTLGSSVFIDCCSLKTVNLSPDTKVFDLGEKCFMNSAIQKFEFPHFAVIVPKACFKNCIKLSSVIIHEDSKLFDFKEEAFCKAGIESIFISSDVVCINKFCFSECRSLKEVTFSKDIKYCRLCENAFYMSSVEKVSFPSGIRHIKGGCFEKCEKLREVNFPEDSKIKKIKDEAFKSSGIESLILPKKVKLICKSAFENCQNLRKVAFLADDVFITDSAFFGCNKLEEVKYELSLTVRQINFLDEEIEKEMIEPLFLSDEPLFQYIKIIPGHFYLLNDKWSSNPVFCKNIELVCKAKEKIIEKQDNVYYANQKKELIFCDNGINSLNIDKETEMISLCALRYSNLTNVNFGNNSNLKIIDSYAFENLLIEEISLPDSLEIIGNWSFNHCFKLKKVNIGAQSKLETIGKYAFCGTIIESFLFPSKLSKVDDYAFFECFKLKTVDNHSNEIKFGEGCFCYSAIESIQFPSKTIFSKNMLKGCYNFKKLTFLEKPEKVVFKKYSFIFSGLEEIRFECDVVIRKDAFTNCPSLKRVILLGSNNKIMKHSFDNSSIELVTFDKELTLLKRNDLPKQNFWEKKLYLKWKMICNDPFQFSYFQDVLFTNINEASMNLIFPADEDNQYDTVQHEFFLNNKCFVVNNKLVYADMLNTNLLFEKQDENEEIKNNEILHVPNKVKSLDFPVMSHIKKIVWGSDCIVEDLGPPGFFSYYNLTQILIPKLVKIIPPKLFDHCQYLSYVRFEKDSLLEEIGDSSFAHTRISEVVLPKSVQRIGKSAFADNENLKKVIFDGQVIDDEAFSNTGITSFKLSNNATMIGSGAFQHCRSLKTFDVDIENSNLSKIGSFAFYESSITSIKIPSKVEVIKKFTFNGCKYLKEVIFSNNSQLHSIKDNSFSGDLSLEKINLPKTIKKLSHMAFINTPSLESILNESNQYFNVLEDKTVYENDCSLVFVPRTVQKFAIDKKCQIIHSGAFCGPNLQEVSFHDSLLLNIGQLSFAHCTALKEITIPKSVEKIGEETFIGCQNLEKVVFEKESQIKEIPKFCFAFTGLKFIDLPQSIEKIGNSSFYFCINLKRINLHETNVLYIGRNAFLDTDFEEVKFPSSLRFIGNNAFGGNKSLARIDFSELPEVISCQTKAKLNNFLSSIIPKYFAIEKESQKGNKPYKENVTVESTSLENTNLDSKDIENEFSNYSTDNEDENSDNEEETLQNESINNNTKVVAQKEPTYSSSACFIEENAFCNLFVKLFVFNLKSYMWFSFFDRCGRINEYIVNDNIHLILQKCKKSMRDSLAGSLYKVVQMKWLCKDNVPLLYNQSLIEFCIPKTTKFLYPSHFSCCFELTKIDFEEGINIKVIPRNCFANTPLKKIVIPSSVRIIKKKAFFSCSDLEEIIFQNDSELSVINESAFCKCEKLTNINIPKSIEVISKSCFAFSGLKSIEIPSSVKKIDSGAFYNCNDLSHVTLNSGLIEICENSFAFNSSLASIDLPDTITTIKSRAFYKCKNLKKVKTTEKTQLVEIQNGAFEYTEIEEISLNRMATKLFDPVNMPDLNRITFYGGEPENFIQSEDGSLYEKMEKEIKIINSELEEKMNKVLFNKAISSNSYCCKSYCRYKDINLKDISLDNYNKLAFSILFKRNRSRFPDDESSKKNPLLRLLFIPKNLNVLKIHEDCFSMSISVSQKIQNLTTIEYLKGATNYVFNLSCCGCHSIRNLKTIKILGDYSYIKEGSFAHFESLESVEFGPITKIEFIPKHAFLGCKKLQKISIPSSCISIEEGAFKDCISLSSVELSENLKYIRKDAFCNCSSLESIEMPSSILVICEGAFMNCSKLQNVKMTANEKGIEVIGKNAFRNCTSLKAFVLPQTCIVLGPASFMNCTSLERFKYEGKHLLSIQCRTFFNCTSLKKIKIDNLAYKNNYNNVKFHRSRMAKKKFKNRHKKENNNNNIDMNAVDVVDDEYKFLIERSSFSIEAEAFMNCTSLEEVVIEDMSKGNAIVQCENNRKLTFKCPVHCTKHTYERGFSNYNLITRCQSVQKKAFCNCKALKHVKLSLGNLERFCCFSFENCLSLKTIEISTQYARYLFSEGTDLDAFVNTPSNLVIKLISHCKCIKTIKKTDNHFLYQE
ncbi:hypothetical protein M9Y10_036126 [Tritrichomonas musculus]|uniref:Surface antigen BspA-like n=1 Tax=Tritrichomonas musculus TaxID=1915356 RepID=A0ABR2GUJ0_9EUKA